MSTNDKVVTNDTIEETASEETETLTQDDEQLRQDLKNSLANDPKTEATDTGTVPNTETAEAEGQPEATDSKESTLTTEVPPEPAKDLDWYKKAYEESTKEGLRLKGELDKKVETPPPPEVVTPPATDEVLTPEQLYIRQKQNEEIAAAFAETIAEYPILKEKETYDRFVAQANILGRVITETDKRFPSPQELYKKTAVILGLTPDNSEAISAAVKDSGAATRTSSGTPAIPPPSKVTEDVIALNQKMYPNKSRQEIIKELEPYIT